jgi:hypothetical protein
VRRNAATDRLVSRAAHHSILNLDVASLMPVEVQSTDISATTAALERPFYFIVVLWGERFRRYFMEFCLPSALAPGNIPALSTLSRSKFLIATRPDDWAAMRGTEAFRLLARYVDPVFVEIPACPPDRSGYQHMGIGHRIACEMAHRDAAYAVVLTPDSMLSDGSVTRLQELARTGAQVVLTAALRFGEEPFFAHLRAMGIVPQEAAIDPAPSAIVASARQLVYAAVNGFHSETLAYEWDTPGLLAVTPAAWWRVPGEDGIVLHSLSWAPLLLDYSAIGEHDTSMLTQWTLDGDYLFNNSKTITRMHVVQDSDEIFLASWGPLAEHALAKTRFPFDKLLAGHFFKQSFYSGFFDPLKRKLFFLTVRWHAKPLNDKWAPVEQQATRELHRVVTPRDEAEGSGRPAQGALHKLAQAATAVPVSLLRSLAYGWMYRHRVGQYAGRLLRGDRDSIARLVWFARAFVFGTGQR